MRNGVQVLAVPTEDGVQTAFGSLAAWAEDLYLAYAWVQTQGGSSSHWQALVPHLNKARKAIIGTSFEHTEPYALEKLNELGDVLRVYKDDVPGVFHPKLILGIKGDEARAIVGSSNLTTGGFSVNRELNVVIEGKKDEQAVREIFAYVNGIWEDEDQVIEIDDKWLALYRLRYARRPRQTRRRTPVGAISRRQVTTAVNAPDVFAMDWEEFLERVIRQDGRLLSDLTRLRVLDNDSGYSYLQEIDACQAAFKASPSFADMTENQRKRIAGIAPPSTGFLGRMNVAGTFHSIVKNSPELIAKYLDKLPLEGDVSSTCQDCLAGLCGIDRIGLSVATRLFAAKRPDLFLPINRGNKHRRDLFGISVNEIQSESYLSLMQKIWESPWFNSSEPDFEDTRIWRYRVAMLDAILYESPVTTQAGASEMFKKAFPDEYAPKKIYNRVQFRHGATVYIDSRNIGITNNCVRNFPHPTELQAFLDAKGYPVEDPHGRPCYLIPYRDTGQVVSVLEGRQPW